MADFARICDNMTENLAKPHWRPSRGHYENSRNSLLRADNLVDSLVKDVDVLRAALAAAIAERDEAERKCEEAGLRLVGVMAERDEARAKAKGIAEARNEAYNRIASLEHSLAAEQAAHQQTRAELAAQKEAHRATKCGFDAAEELLRSRTIERDDLLAELAKAREALDRIANIQEDYSGTAGALIEAVEIARAALIKDEAKSG
jgi:chromosome segregation ATPase